MPGEAPRQAGKADSGRKRDSGNAGAAANGGRPRRGAKRAFWTSAGFSILVADLAHAQEPLSAKLFSIGTAEVMQLSMLVGVMGAALISAIVMIRERARTAAENVELRAKVADLNGAIRRAEALLNLRDQRLVVWNDDRRKPELLGTLPVESGAPDERAPSSPSAAG
jgi:hypothetical protein